MHRFVISFGEDHVIKITTVNALKGVEHSESGEDMCIKYHKSRIACFAVSNTHIVTGSPDGTVALFSIEKRSFEKRLTRSPLSIQHVAFHPDGKRVAIASEEPTIKIVDINDIEQVSVLTGHEQGVKSLAFDPLGKYLVSASCDSVLRIWNVEQSESNCVKIMDKIISPLSIEDTDPFGINWNPNGKYFSVPGRKGDVIIIQRETWKVMDPLMNGHIQPVIDTHWSPDFKYVASISPDKKLCIWKMGQDPSKPLITYFMI